MSYQFGWTHFKVILHKYLKMNSLNMFTASIWLLFAIQAQAATPLEVEPSNGQAVLECRHPVEGSVHVWIFKQWHADPSIDTHDPAKARALPQAANQTAIFKQLDRWVGAKKIKTVVAEGCSGELTRASKTKWNGWTVQDLMPVANGPRYDEIVANVPEKLEAKYFHSLHVLCGDDDALIRAHLLAFSDVRGAYGFLSRLVQYKEDPAQARKYLDGVIEVFKLPPSTTLEEALTRMRSELSRSMARLHAALDKRNEKLLSVIQSSKDKEIAVVYGGLHAPGLVSLLEGKGIGCTVVEPTGYQNDEAELVKQLDEAVKKAVSPGQ
jgi:hypothetical protein